MHSLFSTKQSQRHSIAGFGLIELMVTIGIMLLVTTVVLARHSAFNSAILLRNQAYSIAFSIREAQQQAVSIVGNAGNFRTVYGVHFSVGSSSFPTFRDVAPINNYYDSTDVVVVLGAPGLMDQRFRVNRIETFSGGTGTLRNDLSVTFVRPNFDARFKVVSTATTPPVLANVERAEIEIELIGSSAQRIIEVTSTGQISVRTP